MSSSTIPMHQRRPSRTTNNTTTNGNGSSDMYNDVEGGGSNARRGRNNNASSGGRSSDANSGIMEQQNNERIDELSGQVARLKGLTIDIGNEVREQNNLLDGIGDGFANAGDLLQGSLRRIGTMLEQGGSKHMCYMVSFIVGVMVFLWWLMTFKGKSGA